MRVAVVGAGIVGLSAAWWLRRSGHQVTVLEQGPIPNPISASYDHHRLIREGHSDGDGREHIIMDAFAAWDDLWRDLGRNYLHERGILLTAREPGDWAYACRTAFERKGFEHEVWDRATLAERCPFLILHEGHWGLFSKRGGALMAQQIVDALVTWLRTNDVALREHSLVREIDHAAAELTLDSGEKLAADAIVVAGGAWNGRLLAPLATVTPLRAMVLYLDPPADQAASWNESPCFLDFGGKSDIYLIPPMEGLGVKFGAGSLNRPGDPDTPRIPEPGDVEARIATLAPYVRDLDRYHVTEAKVCYYGMATDERFIAGRMAEGPVYYVGGCSGQMFKFGAVMGRQVARAAMGEIDGRALGRWAVGNIDLAAAA